MILALILQVVSVATATPQQAHVAAYQRCLEPIVSANESGDKKDYQPLEVVLDRIKETCANERTQAREALSLIVWGNLPTEESFFWEPSDAQKEDLLNEATIRWANDVVAWMAAKDVK